MIALYLNLYTGSTYSCSSVLNVKIKTKIQEKQTFFQHYTDFLQANIVTHIVFAFQVLQGVISMKTLLHYIMLYNAQSCQNADSMLRWKDKVTNRLLELNFSGIGNYELNKDLTVTLKIIYKLKATTNTERENHNFLVNDFPCIYSISSFNEKQII